MSVQAIYPDGGVTLGYSSEISHWQNHGFALPVDWLRGAGDKIIETPILAGLPNENRVQLQKIAIKMIPEPH
jgi:hypothetical protein